MKKIYLLNLLLLIVFPKIISAQTGNVGINTPSPTETLDVNGTLRIRTVNALTPTASDPILVTDATGVVKKLTPTQVVAEVPAGSAKVLTTSPLSGDGSTGNAIAITRNNIAAGTSSATATSPLVLDAGATNAVVGGANATLTVNNTAPLWNANKLQGTDVTTTAPNNGQILMYNSTTSKWEPTTYKPSFVTALDENDLSKTTTTTVTATSFTNVVSYNYTPKFSSSTIVVSYDANYDCTTTGYNTDTFESRLQVAGTLTQTKSQAFYGLAGGGGRGAALFPIKGKYANTSTASKAITIDVRRVSSDDDIHVYGDMLLTITETQN